VRVLFSFVGGQGHLDPLLPIAHAAVVAGHDVTFSAQAEMCERVRALGFAVRPSGTSTLFTERQPLLVPDRNRERDAVRASFAGAIARSRAADLLDVIAEFEPDVLVCDEIDFGAMIAAERAGIPHASVVVIASGSFVDAALVADPLNALRAEHGLEPDPELAMLHRHLVLVPVPPRFRDPACPLPSTARMLRPAVLDASDGTERQCAPRARPLVYVTLGTIFNLESDDVLARIVGAIRELPIDVLAAVGPYVEPAELGPQPGNVRVESFVAQHEVLRRAAVVVCHGGSGTVVGALACGVPVVVIPLGADQLDNAARVTMLGVGIALDVTDLRDDDIRRAVEQALTDVQMRARAASFAADAAAMPGPDAAVGLLEALAT